MDRIFSARIDDRVVRRIQDLAQKMHLTKKSVLEQAVDLLAKHVEKETGMDVFDQTRGAWNRKESPAETVAGIRAAFRKSMERHAR